jgi:hypothetical protein
MLMERPLILLIGPLSVDCVENVALHD